MLDEFPGNTWHVRRIPGKDFLALMEELDKRVAGSSFTAMEVVLFGSVG
jgi:hypothetical protein